MGLLGAALISAGAADLNENHLSARPIQNVTTTASDRKFMIDAANDITRQAIAADAVTQFGLSKEYIEAAHTSRGNLGRMYADLTELARNKNVVLPREGDVEGDLRKVLKSRSGGLEREYDRFAEHNSRRMLERFYDASQKAEDREVRAFALRYLRPIHDDYQTVKTLDASKTSAVAQAPPRIMNSRMVGPTTYVSPTR
jgi:hypothetical protein